MWPIRAAKTKTKTNGVEVRFYRRGTSELKCYNPERGQSIG